MKVSVIIPSLNPDNKLVSVVGSLIEKGFDDIILVNDGSDSKHMAPFEKVSAYPQCTILTHEVNKGKGRGLKTAFIVLRIEKILTELLQLMEIISTKQTTFTSVARQW